MCEACGAAQVLWRRRAASGGGVNEQVSRVHMAGGDFIFAAHVARCDLVHRGRVELHLPMDAIARPSGMTK
jgi:hypothetical protein